MAFHTAALHRTVATPRGTELRVREVGGGKGLVIDTGVVDLVVCVGLSDVTITLTTESVTLPDEFCNELCSPHGIHLDRG